MRCDVKFMANYLLNAIPEIRDLLITVNPFSGATSVRDNIRPIRESIQWVRDGGMLVVFPAGAVSHFDARTGSISDPAWKSQHCPALSGKLGRRRFRCSFRARTARPFMGPDRCTRSLRTAMLPKEFFNKDRKEIQVRVGDLVPAAKLQAFEQDDDMTAYLRLRTYILAHRRDKAEAPSIAAFIRKAKHGTYGAIMPPRESEIMAEEIRRLPSSQTLVESNEHAVIQATTDQIPHLLLEIGRLREMTFRTVGEGTGKAVDIDRFDHSYTHLFIWNREKKKSSAPTASARPMRSSGRRACAVFTRARFFVINRVSLNTWGLPWKWDARSSGLNTKSPLLRSCSSGKVSADSLSKTRSIKPFLAP